MIAHCVQMTFHEGVSEEQVQEFTDALRDMRIQMGDLLVAYVHGPNLGLRDQDADYGVVAIVNSEEDLDAYLDDEDHVAIAQRFAPRLFASRRAVQVSYDRHEFAWEAEGHR